MQFRFSGTYTKAWVCRLKEISINTSSQTNGEKLALTGNISYYILYYEYLRYKQTF